MSALCAERECAERPPVAPLKRAGRLASWCRETLSEPVLSVLFPPRCVGCGDFETHLCQRCRETLQPADDCCPRCGQPDAGPPLAGRCAACMSKRFEYTATRSAYLHQGVAKQIVAEFKFGGQPVLGRLIGELAASAFGRYISVVGPSERLLVTWVPAHRKAVRERGYNQAELLARELHKQIPSLGLARLVRKEVRTQHQKGLGKAGRQSNLRGAFTLEATAASLVERGSYEALVLIDDVFTTGATAGEVSRVLREGTKLPVHVFTFSRAVSGKAVGHD